MMKRHACGLLGALLLCGCAASEGPATPAAKRTTIVPVPGLFGFEYSKQGRLAYSKLVDGAAAIFVADSDGSHPKRASFGVWDTGADWSPDGKWIMLSRDIGAQNDVIIVPADSGAERVVAGTTATETPNAWLPDGSGVLYRKNTQHGIETWVYHLADGTSARLLDVDGSAVGYPSPDGKWIVYTRSKDGKNTVWLWDRQTKEHRQVTTEGYETATYFSFSPDSKSLLFESRRSGTPDVWRADVATGKLTQLTSDIAGDFNAAWSPDGSRIVFTSDRGGQTDLWVMRTGESDVQRLTDDALGETDTEWARDGHSVLTDVRAGLAHLYSVPLAGGAPVALTSGDWQVLQAELSPDGSQIAFSGTKNGDEDIWVMPAAGGTPRLVSGAPGFDGNVAWAPDGKHVAFTSARGGNRDVWIAPVDSGAAVRLTDWPSVEGLPEWSPDGKTIAFLSGKDSPGADIWTMPAAGGKATRLTHVGSISGFRWSPDSRSIAFGGQDETVGGTVVYIVPAVGGALRAIAPATSLAPEWAPNGRELKVMQCDKGYCRIDIRSVEGKLLRSLSTGAEIYEFDLRWSRDGSQALVNWQDFRHDGGNRIDVRPAAGGSARTLAGPAGFTMAGVGFAADGKSVIALGTLYGSSLQRIAVP